MTKKIVMVLLLCFLLTSCTTEKSGGVETQKISALELQSLEVLREAGNAEEHFFFDGLELGTRYTDIGKAIDPDGIFASLADNSWDKEDFGGSLSISSSVYTSDKDIVHGTLYISREDYFDDFSLMGVTVGLSMDITQPNLDEFMLKKDELYGDFIKELNISAMQKISEEDIPGTKVLYREKYLSDGYEPVFSEGYVYDDTQIRTKYYFTAAYYTKDNPDKTKGERKIIADIVFSKELCPKTYTLENK